jgi:hypothetical protein
MIYSARLFFVFLSLGLMNGHQRLSGVVESRLTHQAADVRKGLPRSSVFALDAIAR